MSIEFLRALEVGMILGLLWLILLILWELRIISQLLGKGR